MLELKSRFWHASVQYARDLESQPRTPLARIHSQIRDLISNLIHLALTVLAQKDEVKKTSDYFTEECNYCQKYRHKSEVCHKHLADLVVKKDKISDDEKSELSKN